MIPANFLTFSTFHLPKFLLTFFIHLLLNLKFSNVNREFSNFLRGSDPPPTHSHLSDRTPCGHHKWMVPYGIYECECTADVMVPNQFIFDTADSNRTCREGERGVRDSQSHNVIASSPVSEHVWCVPSKVFVGFNRSQLDDIRGQHSISHVDLAQTSLNKFRTVEYHRLSIDATTAMKTFTMYSNRQSVTHIVLYCILTFI